MKKKLISIMAAALCGMLLLSGCGPTPTPEVTPSPTLSPTPTPTPTPTPGMNDLFNILAYQPTGEDYFTEAHISGSVPDSFVSLLPKSDYEGDYGTYLLTQKQALTAGGKLMLDTRSVYYNVRSFNKNNEALFPYINNMLAVRQFANTNDVPFYTLLSAARRTSGQLQTATTLSLQAFVSLGLGAEGVAWADYKKDIYAPLDADGDRTNIWYYLEDTNRRLALLKNAMKNLTVERIYFQTVGDAQLPTRPSTSYIERVEYNIKSDITAASPLMMVELSGEAGAKYLYVVNLSTTQSCYPRYTFKASTGVNINMIRRLNVAKSTVTVDWNILNTTKAFNENAQITEIGVHDTCITAGSAELYRIK